jgi:DNA repair protein RadA/Sms
MSKKLSFICTNCNKIYFKWTGHSTECNSFNSITEQKEDSSHSLISRHIEKHHILQIEQLKNISQKSLNRYSTGFDEINRVLGGGLVEGSVIALTGDPGIGKSTLLLQITNHLQKNASILYISSEESIEQVAERAKRLNLSNNFELAQGSSMNMILSTLEATKPKICILDSIQNCYMPELEMSLGGISQIKYMTHLLVEFAKKNNITIIMTAHITKDGQLAGPKTLEHLVDVVLYLQGEEESSLRIIKSSKNRFGSTEEVGFMHMTSIGFSEEEPLNNYFVEQKILTVGSALTLYKEGSRSFLVEIQALVTPSKYGMPQRIATGIDHKQFMLLISIIERYIKLPLHSCDIFCKVVGGMKIKGNSADLSIAIAIISSFLEKKLNKSSIFLGEVGVTGNICLRTLSSYIPFLNNYKDEYQIVIPHVEKSPETQDDRMIKIIDLKSILTLFNN